METKEIIDIAAKIFIAIIGFIIWKAIPSPKKALKKKLPLKELYFIPSNMFEVSLANGIAHRWDLSSEEIMVFFKKFLNHHFSIVGNPIKSQDDPPPTIIATRSLPLPGETTQYYMLFSSERLRRNFMNDTGIECWMYTLNGEELLKHIHNMRMAFKKIKKKYDFGILMNPGSDAMLLWKEEQVNGFCGRLDDIKKYYEKHEAIETAKLNVSVAGEEEKIQYELDRNMVRGQFKIGQKVQLRTPKEEPIVLLDELRAYLRHYEIVNFAYIGWIKQEDAADWHYVFGFDVNDQSGDYIENQFYNELAIILRKHISQPDYADLITVMDDGVVSRFLKTRTVPFYVNEKHSKLWVADPVVSSHGSN